MSEPLRFQRDLKSILRLMRGAADHVVISRLGWALVLTVASGMLGGLAPLALKQLIDGVSQPSPSPAAAGVAVAPWLPMLMIYAVLLAGARLLAEVRLWPASQGEQRLVSHMTGHAFKRLLHLPLQRQLEQPPGAAVQTVDQAMVGIQILLAHLIGSVVPMMVELGTAAWVLLQLGQPWVVVTLFITALAYGSLHAVLALRLVRHADAVAEAARGVRTALTEGLSHPEAVQALEVHAPLQRRLDRATRQLQHRWQALAAQRAALGLCTSASLLMAMATVLTLALHSLHRGELTAGGFVLVNAYLLQLLRPMDILGQAVRDIAQAVGYCRPLLRLMATTADPPLGAPCTAQSEACSRAWGSSGSMTGSAPMGGPPAVELSHVGFGYDAQRPTVRDLDLHIPAGHTLALVGPSGSGKSSVLRLVLGLLQPQAGHIRIEGHALTADVAASLRQQAGVVLQDLLLIDDTLFANIALGAARVTPQDVQEAAALAQLSDCIARWPAGYDTRLGDRGLRLSGGERQRVALARALVRRPRWLLLDEATSMLDTATEAAVLRNLQSALPGCTILMIAHRLASIQHADQIVVLDQGTVVEQGDHALLLSRGGLYARLWAAQAGEREGAGEGLPLSR